CLRSTPLSLTKLFKIKTVPVNPVSVSNRSSVGQQGTCIRKNEAPHLLQNSAYQKFHPKPV
ncbi:12461_t:CDS:2, partial [Gigaspora rosea]